jgi:pimeloyl-ACP methyl ester carboxylesterase
MKVIRLFLLLVLLTSGVVFAQEYQTPQELADENGAFADVDGVSIYYETMGEATNPVVVLIHGFGGSTFTWRDTMPALAEANYYAVALDLPPFGLSDKNPDLNFSRSWMADMVAGLMDTLAIEKATIVGHSMGGGVTAQFAVRHSAKVEKLVFVAGGIFEALEQVTESAQESETTSPFALLNSIDPKSPAAPILLRSLITKDFFVNTIKSAYFDDSIVTEEVADGYAKILQIEEAPVGFLAYLQAEETSPITLDDFITANTFPTLLLWGEEDTWVTLRLGELMNEKIAGSQLVVYPNIGHLPMEETVEDFNTDLIAFLQAS